MEIRFQNLGPEKWSAECLLAPVFQGASVLEENPELDVVCPWLAIAPALRDFKGSAEEISVLYGHPDLQVPRLVLVGLGKLEDFSLEVLRKAIAKAIRRIRSGGIKSIVLPAPVLGRLPGGQNRLIQESVFAALLGLYRFTELKTDQADLAPDPDWLAVGFGVNAAPDDGQAAARRGERDAQAVMRARDLDNLPGNHLYPETLALKVSMQAHEYGLNCSILAEEELREQGLGCLLAVGQGSSHPPRLIVLEHAPEGHEQEKPLVFIGKGITFDSGGLCLKPPANMGQMKCDMSGAAAVFSALLTLAEEKTGRRIIGLLPCAENMPDGGAFRPGDVFTCASGESVEVLNTDAEGRLALCDALAYAQREWTPLAIVDIATLTGACAVALGNELAGLFCDDRSLREKMLAWGAVCGENLWPLPLWQPYAEKLKSEVADIKNTGPREGGAISAALFLGHFVRNDLPWAHMDIAGVDWSDGKNPLCPEGATGFGVRTLLELGRGGLA